MGHKRVGPVSGVLPPQVMQLGICDKLLVLLIWT